MKRSALIDNAKVILIFLVVFGHLIQPFVSDHKEIYTLYMWIYTFHMPAFIMLSGFFAKGSGNKDYIINLIKKLLVPYVIFQLIYTLFFVSIGKSSWQMSLIEPHWGLWFLFSLFSWHLLLIIFKRIPPYWALGIALGFGLISGYIPEVGQTFSLARTIVFFPFFLVGYWISFDHLALVKKHIWKVTSVLFMLGLAVLIYALPEFTSGWLLGSHPYIELAAPISGSLMRLVVYLISAVMVASFLAFVPERKLMFTQLGGRTLYVYLLHGFFIHYVRSENLFQMEHMIDLFALMAVSWTLVMILSSKPVLRVSAPFIEFDFSRFKNFIREKTQSA